MIASGAAIALSLGLGTRDISKNIVSGVYVRELVRQGSTIEFDGLGGKVASVSSVGVSIDQEDGTQIVIPSSILIEKAFCVGHEGNGFHPTPEKSRHRDSLGTS